MFWFVYKVSGRASSIGPEFALSMIAVVQYLFLLVIETEPASETGGLFYPKALTQVFVGLYIEQLCLCGLFFLARANGKQSAIPEGALMVVLIVITALFQIVLRSGYAPLIKYLPLSVADKMTDRQSNPFNNSGLSQNGQNEQLQKSPASFDSHNPHGSKEKDESSESAR